ncbi:uncharacterized protein KD926_004674 [Aspergillus affinis]|uniref:uncharacterized protein n=1 Tax=Aspergillus affinis TaxID=1070780 RepID=UPI0022FE6AE7|nr:uncharacterized protein KD926_004674 [Aspergillus affinis]KAI9035058.1 hypothetical protein KD926_004674 [Aspergillus affinis]
MIQNVHDVSTAIEILIRFIRFYDKVVAENISLLLNPITRGDINGGLLVLKKRLCQATDQAAANEETANEETTNEETINEETTKETTNEETTNEETINEETTKETTNEETINEETTNEETTNEETINEETTNEETINEETTNEETINEETDREETINEETDREETINEETDREETTNEETTNEETTEETDIQIVLQDPDSKLIYESFRHDLEKSATEFIATYGANPDHFWNKLPLLSDGHIVSQLLKVLGHHSEMNDLTQRLLEIKLYEQVQLLENAFVESNSTLRKGETTRSVALQRVLGHKASRAEDFKVDRGKKLSHFELVDLFRISKPHWRKWRKISMSKVHMIRKNLKPVQEEWAKDLNDVLSKIYKQIPSRTPFIPEMGEGEARTPDSEAENSNLPILSFSASADQVDSQADSLESRKRGTIQKEQNSSSAEAIISNKRSACDLYPLATKRQCVRQVALPSQGHTAESGFPNNRTVQPSNDNSARPGMLDVSPLRDFGTQSNPVIEYQTLGCPLSDNSDAINLSSGNQPRNSFSQASTGTLLLHDGTTMSQKQTQLFEARTRSRQSSLAPVVGNSIYPDGYSTDADPIDAINASAEPRVSWPTGMDSYDPDADPIDAINASAEPRVSWPTGMDSYDPDADPIDAIIASAEPRISWPSIDDIVSVEHGAYQWSPPNIPNNVLGQHSVTAT